MCGILGLLLKEYIDKEMFERAFNLIRHRGPDDSGIQEIESKNFKVMLGHKRLAIVDLSSTGHQPMHNEDKTIWITANGEIFNYRELRKLLEEKEHKFYSNSDTEIIIHAYEEWGVECVNKFNGMFAFAIWDSRKSKMLLVRDRLGIKPLYYSILKNGLIFSSEIKSLLATDLVSKEPDWECLHSPLQHFIISPRTGFLKIYKIIPGHMLIYSENGCDIKKYWDIKPDKISLPLPVIKEKLESLLESAVKMQMTADVPVGVLLSGGLDSSLIVAFMSKLANLSVRTFTIKFGKYDKELESVVDDSIYAARVANLFSCDHSEIHITPDIVNLLPKLVWHLDEPIADPAAINAYLIAKESSANGIKVLLSGMGGDEIFGGYRKYLACLIADIYHKILPKNIKRIIEIGTKLLPVAGNRKGYKLFRWAKHFTSFASNPALERFINAEFSAISAARYNMIYTDFGNHVYNNLLPMQAYRKYFENSTLDYLTTMCLIDTKYFLPDHNLAYLDKATMAAGVESRPPLIDHRIVEFMFTLPSVYRIKMFTQKFLIKNIAIKYLPKEIVYRPKAPFGAPLRAWIRNDLREVIDIYLHPSVLKNRGLYDPVGVWSLIRNDRIGKEDNAHIIYALLTREIWFRTFFDRNGSAPITL